MDVTEFVKEWDRIKEEIYSGLYKYPSHVYIRVVNNGKGFILAQEYQATYGDFIAFYVKRDFKLIYVGGEHLSNIKELGIFL